MGLIQIRLKNPRPSQLLMSLKEALQTLSQLYLRGLDYFFKAEGRSEASLRAEEGVEGFGARR